MNRITPETNDTTRMDQPDYVELHKRHHDGEECLVCGEEAHMVATYEPTEDLLRKLDICLGQDIVPVYCAMVCENCVRNRASDVVDAITRDGRESLEDHDLDFHRFN